MRATADPADNPTPSAQEAERLAALVAHARDVVDLALDADWREAIDLLCDLSDELHAEAAP